MKICIISQSIIAIARVIKIALSNPSVRDVNSIKTLTIEPNRYAIFMEIELDPNLNLDDIDQTISDIKISSFTSTNVIPTP